MTRALDPRPDSIFIALMAAAIASGASESVAARDTRSSSLVGPIAPREVISVEEVNRFPLEAAQVVKVTNLDASGPGSLRAAIARKGARLIVFEIGGVIDLKGADLNIRESEAFVAGETAPDPGITIIRGSLIVETDHVVVRHLAVRPGDGRADRKAPWQPDGITVVRDKTPAHHVVIQNCSATWAVDENTSVSGPRDTRPSAGPDATSHSVVFKDNLIAEALLNSTHAKGPHSMGLLVHDGVVDVRIEGNLFAHNRERNPRLKGGVKAVVSGNVLYNWGGAALGVGSKGNDEVLDGVEASAFSNVAIAGPDTTSRVFVHAVDPGAKVFSAFNSLFDGGGKPVRDLDADVSRLAAPPSWTNAGSSVKAADPASTLTFVLKHAGARPARRDPIDRRIIEGVIAGTGRIIDSQAQVGGYPQRAETRRELKVPDGGRERASWLDGLMKELGNDETLDVAPLLNRLKIKR